MAAPRNADPEFRRKVEEIQRMKMQPGVTSQAAYHLYTSNRAYEALQDRVARAVPGYRLSLREVKTVCGVVQRIVEFFLDHLAIRASTVANLSLNSKHMVLPFAPHAIRELLNDEKELAKRGMDAHLWKFSYEAFLIGYASFLELTEEAEEAEAEKGSRETQAITETLTLHFTEGFPCLEFAETGERISFREFERNARYRTPPDHGFLYEYAGDDISDIPYEKVTEAIHDRMKAARLKDLEMSLPFIFNRQTIAEKLASVADEDECKFLHDYRELYRRAEREHTRKTLDVERQIALSFIYEALPRSLWLQGGAPLVDEALAVISRFIANARRHASNEATPLPDREAAIALLGIRLYVQQALRKNRPWLIEFFDR